MLESANNKIAIKTFIILPLVRNLIQTSERLLVGRWKMSALWKNKIGEKRNDNFLK